MYEDDEDLIERVSDDEPQDDDAMDEGDGNDRGSGQQVRARSGRDVPDDEPPLDGYER
jgi:hypothetical protein